MLHTKNIVLICIGILAFILYMVYFIMLRCAVHPNNSWFDTDENMSDVGNSRWLIKKERWEKDVKHVMAASPSVKLYPGDSVFELGCGTGAFLDTLVKQQPSLHVHGSDINESAIQRCKEKYRPENFAVGDLRFLDINKKFDCIVGNGVLGYMQSHKDISDTLVKCDALLKPGKTMRFTTLDYPCSFRRFLTFRCPLSSMQTSIPPSLFDSFAKKYNYDVHFSNINVMHGQKGRRYMVVLYKKK